MLLAKRHLGYVANYRLLVARNARELPLVGGWGKVAGTSAGAGRCSPLANKRKQSRRANNPCPGRLISVLPA
jgi:hypothetical protein